MNAYGHTMRRTLTAAVFSVLLAAGAVNAQTTTYTWQNTDGGAYGTNTNWDPAFVPLDPDVVVFDKPGTYTVDTFGTTGVENLRAVVGDTAAGDPIDITFDVGKDTEGNNKIWRLTDTGVDPASLNIGMGGNAATARLTSGTIHAEAARLGAGGKLFLTGTGTYLEALLKNQNIGTKNPQAFRMSGAELNISGGAQANLGGINAESGTNTVVIAGSETSVEISGRYYTAGVHSLTITDANVTISENLVGAGTANMAFDNATVTFTGSFAGFHAYNTNEVLFHIKNSSVVSGYGALLYNFNSQMIVDTQSTLTVTRLGLGGQSRRGRFIARDGGTTVNVDHVLYTFSVNGAAGELRLQDGAEMNVSDYIAVGGPNVDGLLEVTGTNSETGITGVGATLTVTNDVYVGGEALDTASGLGTLDVSDASWVGVGGTLQVFAGSKIEIDSGDTAGTRIQAGALDLKADAQLNAKLYGAHANTNPLLLVLVDADITDALLSVELDADYIPVALDGDTFRLLQVNGALTGQFAGLANGQTVHTDLGANADLWTVINYNLGNDSVTLTVIPEPGTLTLLAGALGLLAWKRRR